MDRSEKLSALASAVGDDGTGDLGVIVDCSPHATVAELIEIVLEAREEHDANTRQKASQDTAEARADYDV